MKKKNIVLAQNIRFLRKRLQLSQEELATRLGIKRSNIAAYESKNVEPRLRVLLEMAKLFDVRVEILISAVIAELAEIPTFHATVENPTEKTSLSPVNDKELSIFIEKSMKIRKVLEGFKAFYTFKKGKISNQSPQQQKLIFDIDTFIQLMEHLLTYNETIIKALTAKSKSLQTS